MAQLVARFHGMEEVRGSNPLSSTFCFPGHRSDGVPGFLVAWDALGTGSPMSVLFRFRVANINAFPFWVADVSVFLVLGCQCRHRSSVFGRIIGDVCRHRQPYRALRRRGCGHPSRLYDRSPLPSVPTPASARSNSIDSFGSNNSVMCRYYAISRFEAGSDGNGDRS